ILNIAFLTVCASLCLAPHARADDTKPPVIVTQGNTRYIFTTQDEKFRSMLLNAKNLRIHVRDNNPEYYYRDYYRHHRHVGEPKTGAAYYSGYLAGRAARD